MPFLRQKEFLTERRLLLSSRAGNRPSSRRTISPWVSGRAVQLEWFPRQPEENQAGYFGAGSARLSENKVALSFPLGAFSYLYSLRL